MKITTACSAIWHTLRILTTRSIRWRSLQLATAILG